MKKIIFLIFSACVLGGALFAAGPKLSPQTPVVLNGVSAVMTVAGNLDLLQRPRAEAVISWDEAKQAYVATLDRKFFCLSCPEQSDAVELFFFFKADKEICFTPARRDVFPLSGCYFASFSGSSGDFPYSAAANNNHIASISTSWLLDQPGQYYVFKLYAAVMDGGSLRFVPLANGEVKIYLKYKKNFTAPSVAR